MRQLHYMVKLKEELDQKQRENFQENQIFVIYEHPAIKTLIGIETRIPKETLERDERFVYVQNNVTGSIR